MDFDELLEKVANQAIAEINNAYEGETKLRLQTGGEAVLELLQPLVRLQYIVKPKQIGTSSKYIQFVMNPLSGMLASDVVSYLAQNTPELNWKVLDVTPGTTVSVYNL